MTQSTRTLRRTLLLSVGAVAFLLAGCSNVPTWMGGERVGVKLSGTQEVPPLDVPGSGSGHFSVDKDGTVTGSITTTGVAGVAAHIHIGAVGKNGPVIVPLQKTAPDTWSVPEGKKLTESQLAAYKAGDLYVNVHTAKHKGGEVRGQITP